MKISIQKLPRSQVEISIEVPAEELNKFIEKVIFNLGKDLEVEGFRRGNAPKEMIEKAIGQEKIFQKATEECIRENYLKVILENKIEVISQPKIEILPARHSPALEALAGGKLASGNPLVFRARVSVFPEVKLPDYKKIASEVKKKEVSVSKDYNPPTASSHLLRKWVPEIERLRLEKERIEREMTREEILEKIAQKTELEIPEILAIEEQNRMLEDLKQQVPQLLQISFEDYLTKLNKTEKELLNSFLEEAQKRVKNTLVLREISKKENIEVFDKEIEEKINQLFNIYPSFKKTEKEIDREQLKEYTKSVIQNEKTLQLLESLTKKL